MIDVEAILDLEREMLRAETIKKEEKKKRESAEIKKNPTQDPIELKM